MGISGRLWSRLMLLGLMFAAARIAQAVLQAYRPTRRMSVDQFLELVQKGKAVRFEVSRAVGTITVTK